MKAELVGSNFVVALTESDVAAWADRWPCYGERRPLAFEFSAGNGDIVDIQGDDSDNDESGVAALSNDACLAGALALGLDSVVDMRRAYGDAESIAELMATQ